MYIVGKIVFWNEFQLSTITWHQLVTGFLTVNLFCGAFALWIAGALSKIQDLGPIYFRFINPLFIFGCYFFTWHIAYELSPVIGYLTLLDPLSYVMEIMRAAILGQEGYLPFWASFATL